MTKIFFQIHQLHSSIKFILTAWPHLGYHHLFPWFLHTSPKFFPPGLIFRSLLHPKSIPGIVITWKHKSLYITILSKTLWYLLCCSWVKSKVPDLQGPSWCSLGSPSQIYLLPLLRLFYNSAIRFALRTGRLILPATGTIVSRQPLAVFPPQNYLSWREFSHTSSALSIPKLLLSNDWSTWSNKDLLPSSQLRTILRIISTSELLTGMAFSHLTFLF